MKKLALFLMIILLGCNKKINNVNIPSFQDYEVQLLKIEVPCKPDLNSHPRAKNYKSQLTWASEEGVNFAGKYALTSWGCGSLCEIVALVDLQYGKVVFGPYTPLGYSFTNNSKLLIVNPTNKTIFDFPNGIFTEYYILQNNEFKLIYKKEIEQVK